MRFVDRREAGRRLGEWLRPLAIEHPVVLGVPRGGILVAEEVARVLRAPLDLAIVRRLRIPFHPDVRLGAVGEDGVRVLNEALLAELDINAAVVNAEVRDEEDEVARRVQRYRGDWLPQCLNGASAIIVDDRLVDAFTARAAIEVARRRGASRVVLAAPVGAAEIMAAVGHDADTVVCLQQAEHRSAVGECYRHYSRSSDDEVAALVTSAPATQGWSRRLVSVPCQPVPVVDEEEVGLPAALVVPPDARAAVVLAYASGMSRTSHRNRSFAHALNQTGLATLLVDLAPSDAGDRATSCDVPRLGGRLISAVRWLRALPGSAGLPVGLFSAGTGAAAAIWAAAEMDGEVQAVAARSGRLDLAAARLSRVGAPTLLVVGERDPVTVELNREAQGLLRCPTRLRIVPGASHLFEEPGTLEQAQAITADWFRSHLTGTRRQQREERRIGMPGGDAASSSSRVA